MTSSNFIFNGQKKEFLDWLESLKISKYWLDTLSIEDSYALSKEILEVLENFEQLELTPKEKLFTLIEIYTCLKGLCVKLQESYIKSQFPLADQDQEYADLISNAYMALAKSYYEIINADSVVKLSKKHIALTICRGFQALNNALVNYSEIYKSLPNEFWPLYYRLYSNAEIFTVMNVKVKMDEGVFSIALLLKKVLILYIIDTNQLTPREIREIDNYAIKIAQYVDLKKESMEELNRGVGFYFEKDIQPEILKPETTKPSQSLRFINIVYIIKVIQFLIYEETENKHKHPVNIELLKYVIKGVIEKQQDKSQAQIHKKYSCYALIGIYNIIDFLLEKEDKMETERHRIEKADFKHKDKEEDEIDSLQLMLDWDENKVDSEVQQSSSLIKNLQIIGSSIEGYQLFWEQQSGIELQIGQVIGIIPDFRTSRNRLEIGLIRRITIREDGIIFNVELLGLESTLIQIEKEDSFEASEWELFLFGSPKYDVSILYNREHEYQVGEDISVLLRNKKISCKLGNILNSTPLVNHITLSYL
ncbi:MAG: hypothetical protein GQ569_10580 [Methylococcaceae bacterium]|nr:hypothetical protein [Methylococcaceae bacterium]